MDAIQIVVERFDGKKRYTQEYTVDKKDVLSKTVLGTLIHIKEKIDPTLNFSASCRSAICGACGVRLNGQPLVACDTKMEDVLAEYPDGKLCLAPLANFRVLSDLMVDWEPAMENLRKVHPALLAKAEFSREKGCRQSPANFDKIKGMWDCILCGCCVSACSKLSANAKDYMEPFVFNHAARMAVDERSKNPLLHGKPAHDNGLWKCVHCQECANVCPKQIAPVHDIAVLRRVTYQGGLTEGKGPEHAKAFLTDLRDTGRLNEIKMALRTEGLSSVGRTGLALQLMIKGKMQPLELLNSHAIEGHVDLVRILDAARAATQGKE